MGGLPAVSFACLRCRLALPPRPSGRHHPRAGSSCNKASSEDCLHHSSCCLGRHRKLSLCCFGECPQTESVMYTTADDMVFCLHFYYRGQ